MTFHSVARRRTWPQASRDHGLHAVDCQARLPRWRVRPVGAWSVRCSRRRRAAECRPGAPDLTQQGAGRAQRGLRAQRCVATLANRAGGRRRHRSGVARRVQQVPLLASAGARSVVRRGARPTVISLRDIRGRWMEEQR